MQTYHTPPSEIQHKFVSCAPPVSALTVEPLAPTPLRVRKLPAPYLDKLPRAPELHSPEFHAWVEGAMLTLALHHIPVFSPDHIGDILKTIFEIEEAHNLKPDFQLETLMLRFGADASTLMRASLAVSSTFGESGEWPAPFYRDHDGAPALFLTSRNIIFPVRRGGMVRALLGYEHATDDAPRWVSASFMGGAKAKPSIHICNAEQASHTGACVIVSHALEAEGLAMGSAVTFIARNGLAPSLFVSQLLAEIVHLRSVVLDLPFDAQLVRALRRADLEVKLYEL